MKLFATLALAALSTLTISAHAAEAATDAMVLAPWKDIGSCLIEARGKVTSAKDTKVGGKPGVTVKAKPTTGTKELRAGIQGAKASDFPAGSDFCKFDLGAD